MAKIYYGVMGEGRGHATRVRSLVEELCKEHEVTIFTYLEAYKLLSKTYEGTNVRVFEIPGLSFTYNNKNQVDYFGTFRELVKGWWRHSDYLRPIRERMRAEKPDLVITDFEPLLPRAAVREGIPIMSINHQHFLLVNDFRELPWRLQLRIEMLRPFIKSNCVGQSKTVVSSFFFAPMRPAYKDVLQVGVMLRPEIIQARNQMHNQHGDHLVAYFRRFSFPGTLASLKKCGREVRIYGLGEQPADGNLRYCPISEDGFIQDLATCDGLICTAGNQLVGEAHYFGKPILAMPEPQNYEQFINAHFLKKTKGGTTVVLDQLTPGVIGNFLERVEEFRENIDTERVNGNPQTLAAIHQQLLTSGAASVLPKKKPIRALTP